MRRFEKLISKIFSILILCLLVANSASAEQQAANEQQQAVSAAKVVLGELKKALVEQMKSGGVGHAAEFCSVQASGVQEEAAKKIPSNITVTRVTDRPRNFSNAADGVDLEVMNLFRDGGEKQAPIKRTIENGNRRYYMPIVIEAPCLSCHGAKETLSEDVLAILRSKYPNDRATEYKLGELRGLVRVEVR